MRNAGEVREAEQSKHAALFLPHRLHGIHRAVRQARIQAAAPAMPIPARASASTLKHANSLAPMR